jgi:hypothetical protein
MRDTSTTVFWLQAASWHADIRIPAGRPDFTGVSSLAECQAPHLAWLATQQGFAGMTEVGEDERGETCTWRRLIDYQPAQATPDVGLMQFEPTRLVETGVHARYLEHWHRVAQTSEGIAVLQTLESADTARTKEMLFLAGQYVMHLRWPGSGQVARAVGPMLELAISFGARTAQGYAIVHSTMPWLEGRERVVQVLGQHAGRAELSCDGCARTWTILELPAEGLAGLAPW